MEKISVADTLDAVVTQLRAGGVPADVEPARVRVPGAWVTATQYEHGLLGGGGTATVEIYLVVNERPGGTAWRALDSLYRKALLAGVIPTEPTRTNEAVQLQGPQPLPAFVITTTIENC